MKDDLIFVGYRQFTSKAGKDCYVVDFITKPKKAVNNNNVFVSQVAVFTDKDKFSNFVQNNKLLSTVSLGFEIVGDKVRYQI